MDPDTNQPVVKPTPMKKKRNLKPVLMVLLIAVLVAGGAGAYWWRDKEARAQAKKQTDEITTLEKKISALEAAAASEKNAEDQPATTTDNSDNIKDAIKSGNTAALEGYMASTVKVIIAATEGVGDRTPAQAVSDLEYVDAGTDPWDFALSAATLNDYATGEYAQYFPTGAVVGKSANDYLVSFTFNSAGKINGVFMAKDADSL